MDVSSVGTRYLGWVPDLPACATCQERRAFPRQASNKSPECYTALDAYVSSPFKEPSKRPCSTENETASLSILKREGLRSPPQVFASWPQPQAFWSQTAVILSRVPRPFETHRKGLW